MYCGILIIKVIIAGYNLVEIIHKVHGYIFFSMDIVMFFI